jgi:predicted Zn finger-like uncharacterized protein
MEFRCPACNTSYRVPVRIDQQVRCARCNHVWRIAESDFVIDEDARDETEMPEAFSSPDAEDESNAPGVQGSQHDGPTYAESNEEPPASRDESPLAPDDEWADDALLAYEREEAALADEPADPGPEPGRDDEAPSANQAPEPADAPHDPAADSSQQSGSQGAPTEEDAESFDRRLADSWFSSASDQTGHAGRPDEQPHAAFERIMEGIEEVISESSGTDDGPHSADPQGDDPLRALMSEERARTFGAPLQDEQSGRETEIGDSDDPWGGKVVRLTARGGDRRVEGQGRDDNRLHDAESAQSENSAPVEPMAELIDKIAAVRAEPSDFADREANGGTRTEPEPEAVAHAADDMSHAHFEALQADMEDAAHAMQKRADQDGPAEAESWSGEGYHDEAHEEAQSESLAFDTDQDAFDTPDGAEPRHDPYARDDDFEAGDPLDERNEEWDEDESESWRDEPADIFVTEAPEERRRDGAPETPDAQHAQDDEALLAEYDFGDDEPAETPPEVAKQARRGAGTLTVAAAWALFLAVLAAGAVSVISFREQVADALPASAPLYAAIGFPVDPPPLVFGEVGYSWDETSPNTLILTGQVVNNRSQLTEVPNMQITARDENGELVAEESQFLGQSALVPNETYDFRVRFEVSPDKLRTVELRF